MQEPEYQPAHRNREQVLGTVTKESGTDVGNMSKLSGRESRVARELRSSELTGKWEQVCLTGT